VPTIGPGDDLTTSAVAPVAGLAVIGAVVGGALWARTPAAPEVSEDTTITIENFTFVPDPLTVAAGSSATWTNTDAFEHSIVGDDGSFTSDPLGQGDTFAFEFGSAGEFTYKCGIHPTMTGTIEVTE